MSIFFCDLCPLAFATQGELSLHKNQHQITSPPAFTSYQPNQGNAIAGSSSGAGIEMLIAASIVYWMSRDKRYPVDYSPPQQIKLEPYNSPPKAKRSRSASKSVPLAATATRRHAYQCDECMMEFPSYHALGGHKSGHRKAEARFHAAVAQLHWVTPQPQPQPQPPTQLQPQPQPQPQEAAPPPPPSLQQQRCLFNLNEPPPEEES